MLLLILQQLSTIPLHPTRRMSTKSHNLPCNSAPGQQRPPKQLPRTDMEEEEVVGPFTRAEQVPEQQAPGNGVLPHLLSWPPQGHGQ